MQSAAARTAPSILSRCLFASTVPTARVPRPCIVSKWLRSRNLTTAPPRPLEPIPLHKHLKDEAKRKKAESKSNAGSQKKQKVDPRLEKWELTVGIEVHAELNTARKLFSSAPTESGQGVSDAVNSRVTLFDAALPGAQPQFQLATLLPALRAAIALDCEVQRKSGWDRKHYFHWDQPNGYQITQYYHPFAKSGALLLTAADGVPISDLNGAESLSIGIKQIQMEQDTAKTTHVDEGYHVDLNRAGLPLIEIITLPQIHSPQTAAAVVRKIQALLKSVDACVTGMELGGLRADVNVSIRQRGTDGTGSSYSGVSGLGQRTEIKNLSSFKAVEDAIIAERDRQINVLEAGGVIEGETRGWTLGATETARLRGKEGEVDYRYMPDADLPPLIIGQELVDHLRSTLPTLPDELQRRLQEWYGISLKDARTLIDLDDGDRLDFFERAVDRIVVHTGSASSANEADDLKAIGKRVANWLLHELGGLYSTAEVEWDERRLGAEELAEIIVLVDEKHITARVGKHLLASLFNGPPRPASSTWPSPEINRLIEAGNLRLRPLSEVGYKELAMVLMAENPEMVKAVREKGQRGKVMWFVGQMVRRGEEGTVEPEKAKDVIERLLGS